MKNMVLRVVTPCSSEKAKCFGGIDRLHRQGRIARKARNKDKRAGGCEYGLLGCNAMQFGESQNVSEEHSPPSLG
jgi:hypothetical protein